MNYYRGRGIPALFIYVCNIHLFLKLGNRMFQEVIHGQTPLIVPEMDGCPVQKLTNRTTRIEEFKR